MSKFVGVEPLGSLNVIKFRHIFTGPVKLCNRDAHTFPESLFNRAGVNACLCVRLTASVFAQAGTQTGPTPYSRSPCRDLTPKLFVLRGTVPQTLILSKGQRSQTSVLFKNKT